MTGFSPYDDQTSIAAGVAKGEHRELIGGLWDEIGRLQLEFLQAKGLKPHHKLLDIGCGSLRLGVRAVDYLEASNYWGTDINESLLTAGYDKEIMPAGLTAKLARSNLLIDPDFKFGGLPRHFEFVIAQSVFTHLPLDHLRHCLTNLAAHLEGPCTFFVTVFIAPESNSSVPFMQQPGAVLSHPDRDPYHCSIADLHRVAAGLPWTMEFIGNWEHPRNQQMVAFRKAKGTAHGEPSTRQFSVEDAGKLRPGDDHYRAFVGPPNRYDFVAASQFALLFALGLRDHQRVLDFGCGSLRLGRLLIPFLQRGCYYGIDPNRWLIEEGFDRELGRDIIEIKNPTFAYNGDFNIDFSDQSFDFVIAQSILTHTGPAFSTCFMQSAAKNLSDTGILLFSYLRTAGSELPADGWHYPGCVSYNENWMMDRLRDVGLHPMPLPWYHPGAAWMTAARSTNQLPSPEHLRYLTGIVLRDPQFVASLA